MLVKKSHLLLSLLLVAVLLAGCADQTGLQKQLVEKDSRIAVLEDQVAIWERLSESQGPLLTALDAIQLIKSKDLTGLSALVHPEKGLRLTPYPYVDLKVDQVFTAQAVAGLAGDATVYQWGNYDGSGEPIKLSFNDYYQRFIYDHEFAGAQIIGNNHAIGMGNTLDNAQKAYPAGKFVEFYFAGFDPQYEGMDWSSLKLVFEQQNGTWYLVGIVHGQWTI